MPGRIGEELGIEPGDKLLAINGNEIEDVFDYHYYVEMKSYTATDRETERGRMGAGD